MTPSNKKSSTNNEYEKFTNVCEIHQKLLFKFASQNFWKFEVLTFIGHNSYCSLLQLQWYETSTHLATALFICWGLRARRLQKAFCVWRQLGAVRTNRILGCCISSDRGWRHKTGHFCNFRIDIARHIRLALKALLESHSVALYDGAEKYEKIETFWILKLKFWKTVVYEQFMNVLVHELFTSIALSRKQMTLIAKFLNN